MTRKLAALVLAVCIIAVPAVAQTTTELLQKGIYAQETEGNLDTAILIYRQIVNSAPSQRDLAAQAQFRLGQALLQKGDLTSAAQEFDTLARNYSDYRTLVSSLSAQSSAKQGVAVKFQDGSGAFPAIATLSAMAFDESKPVKVLGKVVAIQYLMDPQGCMIVEDSQSSRYIFLTASAKAMKLQGFTKETVKLGDTVEVTGVLTASGQMLERATPARADLITFAGKTVFDRATLQTVTSDQTNIAKQKLKMELSQVAQAIAVSNTNLNVMRSQYPDNSPEVQDQMKRIALMQQQVAAIKAQIGAEK
jgi:hypothetical protein